MSHILSCCPCRELCEGILRLNDDLLLPVQPSYETIRDELRKEIGSEIWLLATFIPALHSIFGDRAESASSAGNIGSTSNVEAKLRFGYAFQKFIRVASQFFSPLVIFLDDLQWAERPRWNCSRYSCSTGIIPS
jgi:hypothetical protein